MATATPFPQLERDSALQLVSPVPFPARTEALAARATSLSPTALEDLPIASDLLQSVLSLKSSIVSYHAETKSRAYEAHQAACRAERVDLDPVLALEKKLKGILASLETKRQQEQAAAELAARQAAERAAAEMQEQLIEAAEQSGASGADIATLCQMPLAAPAATTAFAVQKPQGISASDRFVVTVTDLKALAQAVLDGNAPQEALQPNLSVLSGMAKALKGNLHLPGVSVTRDLSIAGRKRR